MGAAEETAGWGSRPECGAGELIDGNRNNTGGFTWDEEPLRVGRIRRADREVSRALVPVIP